MEGFRFDTPYVFALVPVVIVCVWLARRSRQQPAAIFSSLAGLQGLPVTLASRARRLLPFLYALGLVLLVAALARPQVGKSESRIHTEGIAIEMVVDVSGTMQAEDFELDGKRGSRLNAVKHVFREFVLGTKGGGLKGRPNDLIGLVAFGGFADSKCPLTLDHGALADTVQTLEVPKPLRDRQGNVINERLFREEMMTAIGDGLALALDRLRNVEAKSKVVILLTDGDNNAGVVQPPQAAEIAQKMGVKVYTIGIGRTGWAPMPVEDEFGQRSLERVQVRLDENLLREIAEKAAGRYFNATNTQALAEVYSAIDKMEKSKVEETRYTDYTELYLYFAVPGMALVMMVSCLEMTRFRTVP